MLPDEVREAVERMCTPLDESRLSGVTAQEDARCMALIRAHLLAREAEVERISAEWRQTRQLAAERLWRAERAETLLAEVLGFIGDETSSERDIAAASPPTFRRTAVDNQCSKCKRQAVRGLQDMASGVTTWFCTMHWNRLIRDRRIDRKKQKSENRHD